MADAKGGTIQRRAWTYRADGNVTGVEDLLSGARTFDLDTTGRVTAVHAADWTERYAYDEAGNQTEASWPAKAPRPGSPRRPSYTEPASPARDGVRYEHDALGRIVPPSEDPPVPAPGHLALRVGHGGPPDGGDHPGRHPLALHLRPPGAPHGKLRLAADGETVRSG